MQCLDARVASFAAVTRPKRSAKIAFPLNQKEYPHLTPKFLAMAGFYHYPGKAEDSLDTCKCFCCDIALAGWDRDDDPHVEHVKRDGECAWKEVVCRNEVDRQQGGPGRLRETFPDEDSLPQSDRNTALRESTFGKWWPHQTPSAKEVAKAGFISTPSKMSPDGTQCPLCLYEVVDWETADDPWGVHIRKEPGCPFFVATVGGKKAPASKARGRTTTTRKGRSASIAAAREPEPKQEEEEGDSLELPDASAMEKEAMEEEAPAPRRRGRQTKTSMAASTSEPPASTRLTKSTSTRSTTSRRKTAATKAKEAETEAEADTAEDAEEEKEEPKRATKPLPRKRTTRKTTTTTDAEATEPPSEPAAPKPRGRPKKNTLATTEAASEPAGRSAQAAAPTRTTKSAATRTKVAKPLTQADSITNVPAASFVPVLSPTLKSPSVRDAVATMMREASLAPEKPIAAAKPEPAATPAPTEPPSDAPAASTLPPLTDNQRKMTLEEYIRKQYALRASEMQADGEALIQKFESRAREARAMLERG